jgi:hypothetical protein
MSAIRTGYLDDGTRNVPFSMNGRTFWMDGVSDDMKGVFNNWVRRDNRSCKADRDINIERCVASDNTAGGWMQIRISRMVSLLACLAIALPVLALQRGSDPLTGTWSGDWGPNAADRNTVNVNLKWDGKALTGVVHSINYQRPDVTLQKATFDPTSGAVHMEADVPNPRGGTIHYVIDGKLVNGTMSGSWNHDGRKGDFKLAKK